MEVRRTKSCGNSRPADWLAQLTTPAIRDTFFYFTFIAIAL